MPSKLEMDKMEKNKQLVERFTSEASLGLVDIEKRAESVLTERYIQHNPFVPSGRAGFIDFFKKFFSDNPQAWEAAPPPALVLADGDYVMVMHKIMRPDPERSGHDYESFFFDLFRIQDGKIDEHWDSAVKPGAPGGLST